MIAALVATLLAAASPADTVYTVDGGRLTGIVLEESPTTGVTIQTPDGAVRRLDRDQVARIEFADGTVSTSRPPPAPTPAPVVQPAAAPRPAVTEGPLDNVYVAGGGRVRGTVMEENATTGTKVRLLDASVRSFAADEITRIEYADGTVSTPRAPPARPREPAAAPRGKPVDVPIDVVYFLGGGRVRGTVIEESTRAGVKVRLLDGSIQTYSREDLVRIEYADGSVSRRVTPAVVPAVASVPAAAAPAPIAPPQSAAAPPPAPAPARTEQKEQLFPLYLSLGVGATFLGGDAAQGAAMSSFIQPQHAHLSGELGLRLSPSFAIGAYGDVGGGEPAGSVRDQCTLDAQDCVATTAHVGFLVRHTWEPLSRRPLWMSLGTGWEYASVQVDNHTNTNQMSELFSYRGREYLRLGAGVDFRTNQTIALGLYGSVAWGEFTEHKDPAQTVSLDRATHTTAQVGLRLTLFP